MLAGLGYGVGGGGLSDFGQKAIRAVRGGVWYLGVFRQFRVKWSIEIRRFWFRRVVA